MAYNDPTIRPQNLQDLLERSARRREVRAEGQYRRSKALFGKEPPDEREMKLEAIKVTKEMADPNAAPDTFKRLAHQNYEKLKKAYTSKHAAAQTALQEAEEQGAGLRAEDVRKDVEGIKDRKEELEQKIARLPTPGTVQWDRLPSDQQERIGGMREELERELEPVEAEYVDLPPKDRRGLFGEIVHNIARPGRSAMGAVGGAVKEAKETAAQAPYEPEVDVEGIQAGQPIEDFTVPPLPQAYMEGTVSGKENRLDAGFADYFLQEMSRRHDRPVEDVWASLEPYQQQALQRAYDTPPQQRDFGVPTAQFFQQAKKEGVAQTVGDLTGAAAEGAKKAFLTQRERIPEDLFVQLQQSAEEMKNEAFQQALREVGKEDKALLKERALQHYERRLASDLPTRHPNLTQFTGEVLFDPLNVIPVVGTAKAAGKALGKIPGVKAGAKVVQKGAYKATAPIRFMPVYDPLRMAGGDMETARKFAQLAEQEAQKVPRLVSNAKEKHLRTLRKVKGEEREALYRAARGEVDPDDLEPHLKEALKAHRSLEKINRFIRNKAGIAQDFDEAGVLQPKTARDPSKYAPAVVRKTAKDPYEAVGGSQRNLKDVAAQKAPEEALPDLAKQWEKKLSQTEAKATATYEVKKLKKYLEEGGLVETVEVAPGVDKGVVNAQRNLLEEVIKSKGLREVDAGLMKQARKLKQRAHDLEVNARKAAVRGGLNASERRLLIQRGEQQAKRLMQRSEKLARRAVKKRSRHLAGQVGGEVFEDLPQFQRAYNRAMETARSEATDIAARKTQQMGVEHVVLEDRMNELYKRVTGRPGGSTLTDEFTVVPKPISNRLSQLQTLFARRGHDPNEAMNVYKNYILDYGVRPTQSTWRALNVLPHVGSRFRDYFGAFVLSHVAHGVKALDPTFQAKAHAGALLTLGAAPGPLKQAFRSTDVVLRSGKTKKLGELVDIMEKLGITGQASLRLAQSAGKGVLGWGNQRVQQVLRFDVPGIPKFMQKLSPEAMARFSDNYQKIAIFMGALEDTTGKGLSDALEFTNKFAGNYRHLSDFERNFVKEGMGFYSWLRFILPHTIQQLFENPARMAQWAKIRDALERESGAAAPMTSAGIPAFPGDMGVTAPYGAQSPETKRYIETGELPDVRSHRFAMTVMEDIYTMGLGLIPLVEATAGATPDNPQAREKLVSQLSPIIQATLEVIYTGEDIQTGTKRTEVLPSMPFQHSGETWEQWGQRMESSHVGAFAKDMVNRPIQAWAGLSRLYKERGMKKEEIDLRARYQAGRDFQGLDNLVMELLGREGLSIGGFLDTGIPGSSYLLYPYGEAMYKKEEAVEGIYPRMRGLEKEGTITREVGGP